MINNIASRTASYSLLAQSVEPEEKVHVEERGISRNGYDAANLDTPVVIVASEISPWSKSGGLAIVTEAYAYEFAMRGHSRVMAVSPMYDDYKNVEFRGEKVISFWGGDHCVKFFHQYITFDDEDHGTDYVFVDHPSFRRAGGLYHNTNEEREYEDNLFRFALFSLAALEAPLCLDLGGSVYGDKCLFIANDWQAGLVPIYLVHKYRKHGVYSSSRCMFVIHNMGYQGIYPYTDSVVDQLGLSGRAGQDIKFVYPQSYRCHALDKGEVVNLTKGAIICADRILTVSANYAAEVQTAEGGFHLQDLVRSKSFYLAGIQNGIDDGWNPATDTEIASCYSSKRMEGKLLCKEELQKALGLIVDPELVIITFIGRLTWQKGIDMIAEVLDWLMTDTGNDTTGHVQLIMMGNGEPNYSNFLRSAEARWKGRVCGYAGFCPRMERLMMAGSDFLLMPSRYEPCGIPQMIALTYGTIPIVHATGGLKDSVKDISEKGANGFHIYPLTSDKMKEILYKAADMYKHDRPSYHNLQVTAMESNFYWPQAIDCYERHIDYTLNDPPLYQYFD